MDPQQTAESYNRIAGHWASSAFHQANGLAQQRPVLRRICDGLNPRGVLIFTSGGVDVAGEISDSFLGQRLDYSALGISGLLSAIAGFGCVCRRLEYDQYPEPHL